MTLSVSNVSKRFGEVEVLRGCAFEISEGESVAVTGPSGSGKSTLLHLLGTLDHPTSGDIRMDGEDPFDLPEKELARFRNQRIGFVFQDHLLLPQYSVLENVLIPVLAFGRADASAVNRAVELIGRVGLSHRVHHRPAELSGGEQQRVALVRALINQPDLLLCDEPTGSLDGARASEVTDWLFELHRDLRNILIVVTHNLDLAGRSERRLDLQEGTCVEA